MIYVIRTDYYDRERNTPFSIIKIGYCKDEGDGDTNRMGKYRTENPYRKVLYKIPRGTLEHEKLLHKKFQHLLNIGYEWFNESEEIYEFFEKIKDYRSLDYILKGDSSLDDTMTSKDLWAEAKRFKIELPEELSSKIPDYSFLDFHIKYYNKYAFKNSFSFGLETIVKIVIGAEKLNINVDKYLPNYYVYYISKLSCDIIEQLDYDKNKLDEEIGRLKALKATLNEKTKFYAKNDIKEEVTVKATVEKLDKTVVTRLSFLIYNFFKSGEKYTNKYIKEVLGSIYKSADFKGAAKATDLLEWFEVKSCKITNSNGSRDHGLEILSVKSQE